MTKDCCQPKTKRSAKQGIDSLLIGIVVVTALLLGGVIYLGMQVGTTTQVSADSQVVLETDANRYDWGTIPINGGIAKKSFFIENKGAVPLKLYNVKTSCMCTSARLNIDEKLSEKFSMHEKKSSVFEVQPGDTAELIVEFDPAFHGPSGIGPISRTVTVETNDANNQTLTFQLNGNVIKQ